MAYPRGFDVQPMQLPTPYAGPDYSGGIRETFSNIAGQITDNRKLALANRTAADEATYQKGSLDVQRGQLEVNRSKVAADIADAGTEKWYGNPAPVIGPDGKPGLMMQSNKGNSKLLPLPTGYRPVGSGAVRILHLGTEDALVDSFGNPVLDDAGKAIRYPIDIAGKKITEDTAAASAKAQAALPAVNEAEIEFNRAVDEVLNDPALFSSTGPIEGLVPEEIDITGQRQRVRGNARKIINDAFKTAYESLKGAGPISEGEGQAATAAIANLADFNVPDEEYVKRLQEAKARVKTIADSMRKLATLQPTLPPKPPAPSYPPGAGGAPAAAPAAAPTAAPGQTPMSAEDWIKGGQ